MSSGLALSPASGPNPPDEAVTRAVARLLESMRFDHVQGTMEILGSRFFFARASLVTNIVRELEGAVGPRAWEVLERAAEATALEACRSWDGRFALPVTKGVLAIPPIWSILGLGVVSVEAAGSEGHVVLRTPNSPWPEAYGPSEHPVCHIFTGYAKGIIRGLGYKEIQCREQRCRAMGHGDCEFDIRFDPAGRLDHAR